MAEYYNRSSGTVAVTLESGRSVMFPGKTWVPIPAEDEGSEALLRALKLGHLIRFPKKGHVTNHVPPVPAKAVAPTPAVKPSAPAVAPAPSPAPVVAAAPAPAPAAPAAIKPPEKAPDVAAVAAPVQSEAPPVPPAGSTDETAGDKTPDNRRRKV